MLRVETRTFRMRCADRAGPLGGFNLLLGLFSAILCLPLSAAGAEKDDVVLLQVDTILMQKLGPSDEKTVQRLADELAAAREKSDSDAIERAERALAKLEERLLSKRRRIILGRTAVEERYQPGGIGPVTRSWRQKPCAVMTAREPLKVDQLRPGDFIVVTRIEERKASRDEAPLEQIRAAVDEPYFVGLSFAYVATGWRRAERPAHWPVDLCATPWALPSEEMTSEAKLEVTVLPEKLVYQYRDCVRYVLKIRNAGDKHIKSANIWFLFRDADGDLVHVQKYWTDDHGSTIVEPRVRDLAPGDSFTIQTFATKSVDLQTRSIDVTVLSLVR